MPSAGRPRPRAAGAHRGYLLRPQLTRAPTRIRRLLRPLDTEWSTRSTHRARGHAAKVLDFLKRVRVHRHAREYYMSHEHTCQTLGCIASALTDLPVFCWMYDHGPCHLRN